MVLYWIWLTQLANIPTRQKLLLLQGFGDPEGIYQADRQAYLQLEGIQLRTVDALQNKDLTQAKQIIKDCSDRSIGIVVYSDSAYPKQLRNIEDPPFVLYYKGILPDWQGSPGIGIVGTRKASPTGLHNARSMGYEIAASGGLVISGGADGIDTAAMEGALQAGKKVVAVLGFGADVVYPAKNRELFRNVERQGCLLTEFIPGTKPYAWHFPMRNRIISGLSSGILVVEAPERSGALNTANHAMDQGRDVFVMPGNVGQESCAGSNSLLRERVVAVMNGWDVMREYEMLYPDSVRRFTGQKPAACQPKPEKSDPPADKKSIDNREKSRYSVLNDEKIQLTDVQKQVLACLTPEPTPVDDVLARLDIPAGKVLSILTMLALKGFVVNHPGNFVSLGKNANN